ERHRCRRPAERRALLRDALELGGDVRRPRERAREAADRGCVLRETAAALAAGEDDREDDDYGDDGDDSASDRERPRRGLACPGAALRLDRRRRRRAPLLSALLAARHRREG